METRFDQLKYSSLLAKGTMLDPLFKNLYFIWLDACVKALCKISRMSADNKESAVVLSTLSEEEDNRNFE